MHAELERVGEEWTLADDGLSRNGSFVNGERVVGPATPAGWRRAPVRRHSRPLPRAGRGRGGRDDRREGGRRGRAGDRDPAPGADRALPPLRRGSEFATPATNRQIADEVALSVDAVKANLRALFERFEVGDLPQNKKRVRLAELALRTGTIAPRDLGG